MSIRVDRFKAVVSRHPPFQIEDLKSFVEDHDFLREFRECGLTNDDYDKVQAAITACPLGGDVVPVTTNVRDMFYYLDEHNAVAIRYVYLEMANTVLLISAYWGTELLPMTAAEAEEAEVFIAEQTEFFSSRFTR